ncbi:hypothetical protein TNCV_3475081 [Trichonephila clavipes]|nr:hypothetical protein TNCV_3475081 [Trichonephila clavipes]
MSPTGERSDEGTSELNRIRLDRKRGRRASAKQSGDLAGQGSVEKTSRQFKATNTVCSQALCGKVSPEYHKGNGNTTGYKVPPCCPVPVYLLGAKGPDKLDLPDFLFINFDPPVPRGPVDLLRPGPKMSLNLYWCYQRVRNDYQRSPAIKADDIPDHNALWVCVTRDRQGGNPTLSWTPSDMFVVLV